MAEFRERAFKALATLLPERKERVTEIHYITNAEIHYHIDRVNITVKEGSVSNKIESSPGFAGVAVTV